MTGFEKDPLRASQPINQGAEIEDSVSTADDYIIPDSGRIPNAPPRQEITPQDETIHILSENDLTPKIISTEAFFAGEHHESGVRSFAERTGFDNEPAMQKNIIPEGFNKPAPIRTPKVTKSWLKRLFGG